MSLDRVSPKFDDGVYGKRRVIARVFTVTFLSLDNVETLQFVCSIAIHGRRANLFWNDGEFEKKIFHVSRWNCHQYYTVKIARTNSWCYTVPCQCNHVLALEPMRRVSWELQQEDQEGSCSHSFCSTTSRTCPTTMLNIWWICTHTLAQGATKH